MKPQEPQIQESSVPNANVPETPKENCKGGKHWVS